MKTLLYIILGFLAFRLIIKLTFPLLLKYFFKKLSNSTNTVFTSFTSESTNKKEGHVEIIENNTTTSKKNHQSESDDYVDFTEIK